jgi:hypothetical protein
MMVPYGTRTTWRKPMADAGNAVIPKPSGRSRHMRKPIVMWRITCLHTSIAIRSHGHMVEPCGTCTTHQWVP